MNHQVSEQELLRIMGISPLALAAAEPAVTTDVGMVNPRLERMHGGSADPLSGPSVRMTSVKGRLTQTLGAEVTTTIGANSARSLLLQIPNPFGVPFKVLGMKLKYVNGLESCAITEVKDNKVNRDFIFGTNQFGNLGTRRDLVSTNDIFPFIAPLLVSPQGTVEFYCRTLGTAINPQDVCINLIGFLPVEVQVNE